MPDDSRTKPTTIAEWHLFELAAWTEAVSRRGLSIKSLDYGMRAPVNATICERLDRLRASGPKL